MTSTSLFHATESIPLPRSSFSYRLFAFFLFLLFTVFLFFFTSYELFLPTISVEAVSVVPKTVRGENPQGLSTVTVQAAGWIEAEPYEISVTALADGVLAEILVLEGDPVQKDQVLARLVQDDALLELQKAQTELLYEKALLGEASVDLKAAQSEWDHPIEEEKNILVLQTELKESHASLQQAKAQKIEEEAKLLEHKSDYDRIQPLLKENVASESDVFRTASRYQAQKARVEAAEASIEKILALLEKQKTQLKAASQTFELRISAKKNLERALAVLKTREALVQQAELQYKEKELQLHRMEIRSPLDGIVLRRHTSPGFKVVRSMEDIHSSHIVDIYDPLHLQVRVDVPLADVSLIAVGQKTEVIAEVLPDHVFSGKVTRIIHQANIQKNTLEVKVTIFNPHPILRPEMLTRVKFLASSPSNSSEKEESRESLLIPQSAVETQGGQSRVWVLRSFDGSFARAISVPIEAEPSREPGWVEIRSGLTLGNQVIVRADGVLQKNGRVKVKGNSSPKNP
jgi:HlyD family secretion protein